MARDRSHYFIEAVAKTLDVLESFADTTEQLTITEIARRTNLPYTSALRFLYTLEQRGYVMRAMGKKRYVLTPNRKGFRIGYAALGKIPFAAEVTRSIVAAARQLGVTLFTVDNEDDPAKALSNAEQLLAERVDLLIEFQRNEAVSHLIATKCHAANVPAIAINFPQPGAYYFGPNSFNTGRLAGDYLLRFARRHWTGTRAVCLILPSRGLGSTQSTRKAGLLEVLRQRERGFTLPEPDIAPAGVTAQEGYSLVRKYLRSKRLDRNRLLVAAFSDPLAVGAERAIREAGLEGRSVIIGQGGTAEARRHILRGGPLRASVAYFPESYGERVLKLAIKICEGAHPPFVSYTDHVILTSKNISNFYDPVQE
jgi:ribose transport system substrate-binding protein